MYCHCTALRVVLWDYGRNYHEFGLLCIKYDKGKHRILFYKRIRNANAMKMIILINSFPYVFPCLHFIGERHIFGQHVFQSEWHWKPNSFWLRILEPKFHLKLKGRKRLKQIRCWFFRKIGRYAYRVFNGIGRTTPPVEVGQLLRIPVHVLSIKFSYAHFFLLKLISSLIPSGAMLLEIFAWSTKIG